ncbi:uncharacterized protein LOC113349778 [Papaver somniferum]|uniref:uncharacterized protein LOC113349778 n=1 Tax=Papaver somniferum TaxID=3469 RepID=UPI000E704540|nr:uncharacterized protein LOC113349778 [Papaver somniferum]
MTASTQPTQIDESLVVTSTTQQTQGDNPETYRFVQLGPNLGDMTDVEVNEVVDEVISDINQGAVEMENAEPTSTAKTQENIGSDPLNFSLRIDKTPKLVGELLKEVSNRLRESHPGFVHQRVLRNRKIQTQDRKQFESKAKKIKKTANEETMVAVQEVEEERMAAVPEVEEERMAEVGEEDDGTMRKNVKGSPVIESLDGEQKKKVLEYFSTHPTTDIAWMEFKDDGSPLFDINGELMLQFTMKEAYLESEFLDFYISRNLTWTMTVISINSGFLGLLKTITSTRTMQSDFLSQCATTTHTTHCWSMT